MKRIALSAALAGIIALLAQPAVAADNGFYLGASVGQSGIEISDIDDMDFSGGDTAYKLFVGYRILTFLAVEGSYVDFGAPDDNLGANLGTVEADVNGFDAFAMGMLPLGIADIFVKAGVIAWDAELAARSIGESESDSGTDPAYGIGVQFRIRSFAIRGEVEYFDIDGAEYVYMYSVGGSYTF